MKLVLHSADSKNELSALYRSAFATAQELYVVNAYLTDWDPTLRIGKSCQSFRIIIGKDFGITRIDACRKVMNWLPATRKAQFLVADNISGFHPKAVLWRDAKGNAFAIVGSSNLTDAAFNANCEANAFGELSSREYSAAKAWLAAIEARSLIVSEDWLGKYVEAFWQRGGARSGKMPPSGAGVPVVNFKLPIPSSAKTEIEARRRALEIYAEYKDDLIQHFRDCANGKTSSAEFYDQLPTYWGYENENRLQGRGWERRGKGSDFRTLSKGFLAVIDAPAERRDDTVVTQLDILAKKKNSARIAFLSEMLCLAFPEQYPIVNQPVRDFLKTSKFRGPRAASEGVWYIDLAQKLRAALSQHPTHPAKSLAELDAVFTVSEKRKKTVSKR